LAQGCDFQRAEYDKDLRTERSTLENDLGVAPQSTLEQQGAADSVFIKLKVTPMDEAWSILEGIWNSE